jgi:hypothetical protein
MKFWDGKIQEFTLLEFLGFQTKSFGKRTSFGQGLKKPPFVILDKLSLTCPT